MIKIKKLHVKYWNLNNLYGWAMSQKASSKLI